MTPSDLIDKYRWFFLLLILALLFLLYKGYGIKTPIVEVIPPPIQKDSTNLSPKLGDKRQPKAHTEKNEPTQKSRENDKEYTIIQLVLNSKNYDDEIYINEEKPVFEEGTSQIIKFIKLEIGKTYRIKVGDCKIQEIKVTQSSIRKIYPC